MSLRLDVELAKPGLALLLRLFTLVELIVLSYGKHLLIIKTFEVLILFDFVVKLPYFVVFLVLPIRFDIFNVSEQMNKEFIIDLKYKSLNKELKLFDVDEV
jgi:hypothetical protein